jgi:hypothetical protein
MLGLLIIQPGLSSVPWEAPPLHRQPGGQLHLRVERSSVEMMTMEHMLVMIWVGGIGQAIVRGQGSGETVLLADYNESTLRAAAQALEAIGYRVSTQHVDVQDRASVRALAGATAELGSVVQVVTTAGVSPSMAAPDRILAVDLLGVALVLEEFGRVIAPSGAGLVISSSGWSSRPRTWTRSRTASPGSASTEIAQADRWRKGSTTGRCWGRAPRVGTAGPRCLSAEAGTS